MLPKSRIASENRPEHVAQYLDDDHQRGKPQTGPTTAGDSDSVLAEAEVVVGEKRHKPSPNVVAKLSVAA